MEAGSPLGALGERVAEDHLVRQGYSLLERNARKKWGELDLVMRAPEGTLVFVEVKTMRDLGPSRLSPEDHLSAGKLERFRRAAVLYAGAHESLVGASRGFRLDAVTITVAPGFIPPPLSPLGWLCARILGRTRPKTLRHYRNIGETAL